MVKEDIKKACVALTKKMGVQFVLRSKKITSEEVFSESGLMPAIVKRANQLSLLCFNKDLGIKFEDSEKSMLGVKVVFDEGAMPLFATLCISDTVIEMTHGVRNGEVSVDDLLYD